MFGLFPLAIAVGVMLFSWRLLEDRVGAWIWVVAPAAGIGFWVLYGVALRIIGAALDRRNAKREKRLDEHKRYQSFNPADGYPVGKDLYYECLVCGNVVPSLSKKNVRCRCRNILVDSNYTRVEIREQAKVKLFSLAPP
jgi:hypothetical protein